jgi:hypothetical protein
MKKLSIVSEMPSKEMPKPPPRPQTSMTGPPTRLDVDTLVGVLANRPGRKSPVKKVPVKYD